MVGREFLSGLFKDEDEPINIGKMGTQNLSSYIPNSAKKLVNKKQKKVQSPGKKSRKG